MKQFVLFIILALVMTTAASANCPLVPFYQRGPEDSYAGLDPRSLLGLYFDLGTRQSNCQGCDPAKFWTYAWGNGVALKGVFGGRYRWQCYGIDCPRPWYNKGCRMVVALSSVSSAGTRYIVDSVGWNPMEQAFAFNDSVGTTHAAGCLKPPSVVIAEKTAFGQPAKVDVHIPIPTTGFYSDQWYDARKLVAGIAVLGIYSTVPPPSLKTGEFEVLNVLPVDLVAMGNDATVKGIDMRIDALMGRSRGTAYYAYTLILDYGAWNDLQHKVLLPYASPIATAREATDTEVAYSLASGTADAEPGSMEPSATMPRISDVKAVVAGGFTELKFHVSGDPERYAVDILRSETLAEWATLDPALLKATTLGPDHVYTMTDEVTRGTTVAGDIWYEIRLTDRITGEILDSLRTLALIP